MLDYYLEMRCLHIAAVIVSGVLFAGRGLALNIGGRAAAWAMAAPLRFITQAVDTLLLAAAIGLTIALQQYPGVDAWLSVKVALLLVYIVLGSIALKRGRTLRIRRVSFVAALLVYGFIVSVARTHDPLGLLTLFA